MNSDALGAAAAIQSAASRPKSGFLPFALGAVLLLSCMPLLAWRGIVENSVTIDEFAHMPAGFSYWRTGEFGLYNKNPPLVKLLATLPWLISSPSFESVWLERVRQPQFAAWEPWVIGEWFLRANTRDYDALFIQTRWMTLLLGMLAGVVVWAWSSQLFGRWAGLLSLSAYVFCPTVLAHSSVATTDVGAMGLFGLAAYALWSYGRKPTLLRMLLAGAAIGLALAAKLTALLLLAVLPLLMLVMFGRDVLRSSDETPFGRIARPWALPVLVMPLVALFVVNASYGFRGSTTSAWQGPFDSRGAAQLAGLMRLLPLPFPIEYVRGFDQQQADVERLDIEFLYLNGEVSLKGWWYYFPAAFAFKEPVALVILVFGAVLALGAPLRGKGGGQAFLLLPLAAILVYMMFFNRLNIGIRYLLPAYPLLFVMIGRLANCAAASVNNPPWGLRARRVTGVALTGIVAWQALSVSRGGPDYLSYFSEAIGGGDHGGRYLLDSNLDWGQDLKRLGEFVRNNPKQPLFVAAFGHVDPAMYGVEYAPPPEAPAAGRWIVSRNYLAGMGYPMMYTAPVTMRPHLRVEWLRDRTPTAQVGRSMLVFDVDAP
ncbi:MAG: glycosyltransferase family 39 protein [Phycisphaerales bacterium]|nr:glycosyltransferase family 39 protein [Phycisphaerales bacterium]